MTPLDLLVWTGTILLACIMMSIACFVIFMVYVGIRAEFMKHKRERKDTKEIL